MSGDDIFLSPKQAAEQFLGDPKRERSVRHFYEAHGLPITRVGGSVLIRVGDFKEWLAARRGAAAKPRQRRRTREATK